MLQEEAVEEHHQFECSLEHIGKRIQADACRGYKRVLFTVMIETQESG